MKNDTRINSRDILTRSKTTQKIDLILMYLRVPLFLWIIWENKNVCKICEQKIDFSTKINLSGNC